LEGLGPIWWTAREVPGLGLSNLGRGGLELITPAAGPPVASRWPACRFQLSLLAPDALTPPVGCEVCATPA